MTGWDDEQETVSGVWNDDRGAAGGGGAVDRAMWWTAQIAQVRDEIKGACRRAGRAADEVRLVGVTKTLAPEAVVDLIRTGLRDVGENRWQQARPKLAQPGADTLTWHFIGHLQSNKVRPVVRHFDWIHSVDSEALGRLISDEAVRQERTIHVLVQVNIAREPQKSGVAPEQTRPLLETLAACPGLRLEGLMTMAPAASNPEDVRWVFRALRELRDEMERQTGIPLPELSMGMSGDFVPAVEEGATMVRIGRRLFPPMPGEDDVVT